LNNDVGEIRRVVSTFLQMVEQDHSDSMIIAATNHIALLDRALFRRFDDIIHFEMPNTERAKLVLQSRLSNFKPAKINWTAMAKLASGLSYADVTHACQDAIKDVLISGRDAISQADVASALRERRSTMSKKERTTNGR